jgi:spore cortex biosynthesis protein YabQ
MTLSVQFQTMAAMIIMGGWLGVALDTYGRFLKRPKREKWVVFIHDCLFWLLQGLIIFYILLLVNQGEVRFYIFLALLCGYAGYQALFRDTYIKLLESGIQLTISVFHFLRKLFILFIIRPIKLIFQLIVTLLLFIVHFFSSLFLFLYNVIMKPIVWLGKFVQKLLPNSLKKIFIDIAGISCKIKNTVVEWWKRLRR